MRSNVNVLMKRYTRSGRQRKIGKAATGGCCLLNTGLIITLVLLIIIILSFSLVSCVKQANLITTTKAMEATTSKYPDIVKLTLDGGRKGFDILFMALPI
jgi:hypothetical protein